MPAESSEPYVDIDNQKAGSPPENDSEPVSALEASIQAKRDNSYYYAHQKKITGEEPAPLPVHVVLERAPAPKAEVIESIFNYQFLDDDRVVKVYLPLEGVGSKLTEADVSSQFDIKSFDVSVINYKPSRVLKLAVRELYGEVVPAECGVKIMSNKITITLTKKPNESGTCTRWSNLKSG